ncbi:hypothetical protein MBEHAL_1505 [Halarchaeum acidiphilum MH1-52-1]|uniref:Uncharacterized protein n=1 Tax=Halarchaeum acidiphilum MH1-52-1 TaxID=1261545 RepID=U2YUP7_9EURY|nr:hypothetical protein MBEHAL_1505 [Halarchaeum acidiphilum MH1-52-1]
MCTPMTRSTVGRMATNRGRARDDERDLVTHGPHIADRRGV